MTFAQHWLRRLPSYAVLTICAALLLFPLYVTFVFSLHPITEFIGEGVPSLWPSNPQWGNYFESGSGASNTPIGRYLFNSVVVAVVITAAQLVTATLSAYAFAFLRFPGRNVLFVLFLATMMVPLEVAIIPNFQTMQWLDGHFREQAWLSWTQIRWIDGYPGLVAPFLATGFGTFLLRQAFLSIPSELRDAAEMDGYGHFRFLWRVAIPITRPVIAAFTVLSFLAAWNSYLWPRAITDDSDWNTIQIGLRAVANSTADQLNVGVAAALLAALPVLIVLILFQRHIVRGLTAGAVKG